jgi:hypothetical protein
VNVREVLAAAVDHPGTQPAQPAADVPWKFKELSNAEQRIMANNWARVMKGKDRMPRMVRGIFTCPFRSCDSYGKDFGSPNAVLMHCDRTHTKRVDPNRNGNPRKKVSEPMTTTNTTNGNVTSQQPQQSSNAVPCKLLECPACGTRFYMVKGSQ